MPTFTYTSSSIRAIVTYTNASPKDLEIQVSYQRFKYGDVSSYNFPAPPSGDQRNEIELSAFRAANQAETVKIQSLCSGENQDLFAVSTSESGSALPAAYVILVPYQ